MEFLLRDLLLGMKVEEHNNVGHENIIYGGLPRTRTRERNVAEYRKTSIFYQQVYFIR